MSLNKPGICAGCGHVRRITNVKRQLCQLCRGAQLNEGKAPKTPYIWKQKAGPKIPRVSPKKAAREKILNAVKKAMAESTPHVCSGCGRSGYLSHSHILPVGNFRHLEAEPLNMVYDCLTVGRQNPLLKPGDVRGCHEVWENGSKEDRQKLLNFEHRIEVIFTLAPGYITSADFYI